MSALGFGASPLGGAFGDIDEAEGIRCVRTALDMGINFIDVAPYYGVTRAEAVLGRALRGVPRDNYYLATKVGRYGHREFDFSAPRVTRSVDESLSRLGIEHVDLIQCHDIEFGDLNQIVEETLPALREVVQQGKARFVGITGLPLFIYPYVLERAEPGTVDTVLSYCHYTLSDTSLEFQLPYLTAKGVGIINAAPLGMGLLTDDPARLPEWHPAPLELKDACARTAERCRIRGVSLAELALSFSLSRADIACTLVGMGSVEELRRNVAAAETVPDPELLAEVGQILRPVCDLSWQSGRPENDPLHQAGQP